MPLYLAGLVYQVHNNLNGSGPLSPIRLSGLGESSASLIHTGASARWPYAEGWGGNRLKRFQTDESPVTTGLIARCGNSEIPPTGERV
jgi:hypothetical protein